MSSLSVRHTQLLLRKRQFLKGQKAWQKDQQEENVNFINSNGIVSPIKLMLIVSLIILSISTLNVANDTHWSHVKALTNYFNYFALGQNGLSIYDRGDNVDETYIQITGFSDMKDHFENTLNFVQNYTVQGFANFNSTRQMPIDVEYYFINGTSDKYNMNIQELRIILLSNDLRELLLSLRVLYFEINFGSNHIIDDFTLIFDYEIYSHSMLCLDMSTKYKKKLFVEQMNAQFVLRNLQRFFAVLLLISYAVQAKHIYYNDKLDKIFRKNSLYWCISLVLLNFVALVSNTLAPLCAMLQLLPVLQNSDSSQSLKYNFNVNLRYAIPIIFRIIVPVYIILNGFILYSMLMYPGSYFDDYITGFFSYFYNNFQYGIYQIFIQIKSRGNVAYLLYGILFFHLVLVGSNLVPALFCTLIYKKMAERQLVNYVQARLELIVCPKCHHQNYQKQNYALQINIQSPKSPYLSMGTKLKQIGGSQQKNKLAKLYIQDEDGQKSPTVSPILTLKNKHKRARDLIQELKQLIQDSRILQTPQWVNQRIQKVQFVLNHF